MNPHLDLGRRAGRAGHDAELAALRRQVVLLAVSALVLTFVVLTWRAERLGVPPGAGGDLVCAEDDPCWDCGSMGNLVCGPVR